MDDLKYMKLYTGAALGGSNPPVDVLWHPELLERLHAGDRHAMWFFLRIVAAENDPETNTRQ